MQEDGSKKMTSFEAEFAKREQQLRDSNKTLKNPFEK